MVSPLGVDVLKHAGLQFKTTAEIFVNYDALTNGSAQGGHERGILGNSLNLENSWNSQGILCNLWEKL